MTVPFIPDEVGEDNREFRQFQAELKSPTAALDDGLSLDHRPDAISLDYLTSFTLGPFNIGDSSRGPVERVWKIRAQGGQVFSSRQKDDKSDFEPEILLFSHAADSPVEIDAAFDQNARVLVCMESPSGLGGQGELLIYYFDPFSASYQLVNFGRGRTPRAVLDDIVDTNNGDILVFYINDLNGICYRQQRDRYLVEYIVPNSLPVVPITGVPIANTCTHGPVVFEYTGDPTVISGTLDGITVEARAPLNIQNGVPVDPTSIEWQMITHTNTPSIPPALFYKGGNVLNEIDFSVSIIPDSADLPGWRIQSNPIGPWFNSTDLVLTFSAAVEGIEIEGINTIDYDNRIIAYDAAGTVLKSIEPTPPYPFAARTGPYAIYAAGIKTVRLVAAAGQVWPNGLSWGRLRFKKTGDAPAIPTLVAAPLPVPDGVVLTAPPLPPMQYVFLEDVYKSTDNRVHILYSMRNPVTGTYTLATKATVLYPFFLPMEAWRMNHTVPLNGLLRATVLYAMRPGDLNPVGLAPDGFTQIDQWQFTALALSGLLEDTLLFHTLYDKDTWQMLDTVPQSGVLEVVLLFHTLYDIDAWKMATTPQSGSIVIALILHTLYDIDAFKMTAPLPIAAASSLV